MFDRRQGFFGPYVTITHKFILRDVPGDRITAFERTPERLMIEVAKDASERDYARTTAYHRLTVTLNADGDPVELTIENWSWFFWKYRQTILLTDPGRPTPAVWLPQPRLSPEERRMLDSLKKAPPEPKPNPRRIN